MLSTILIFLSAVGMYGQTTPSQQAAVEVHFVGQMRKVMRDGDLTATIDLAQLSKRKHLYALGPIEGLRGEITIWDSKPSLARIVVDRVSTTESFQSKACFLVYASVDSWQEVQIPQEIRDDKSFEKWLVQTASKHGVNTKRPFPFLLKDTAQKVVFHVVNKTDDSPHSQAKHEAIKKKFTLENTSVKLLGFYSDSHHGVFTHHDSNIHLHVITTDEKQSGHVESIQFGKEARLLLPK
ncbi:MAG: acetolactate decarboxylase [Planctomycetia bacterium]|nr:acetolactate decarboxylase [Planctomycetia bacterium]